MLSSRNNEGLYGHMPDSHNNDGAQQKLHVMGVSSQRNSSVGIAPLAQSNRGAPQHSKVLLSNDVYGTNQA